MDIGRLNKRITFMKLSDEDESGNSFVNEIGQNVQKLVKFKTVWASIEPTTGREYLEAQRIKNQLTYKIFTRYFPRLSSDMIINYRGKRFEIESLINYRESNEMLLFMCTEMVGDKVE